MKRLLDLTLAIVLLPVALIICLPLMVMIRLESAGHPLLMQTRVGRHRKPFTLYKLRTMTRDTDEVASHLVSRSQVTPLGRKIRRLKIDELPQILNVLKGDMSFVGPRPCLFSQTELIEERDRRGVFELLPGITGPAQVAGIDMSTPARLAEADAAYFGSRSLSVDLGLILRTVWGAGQGDAAGKG